MKKNELKKGLETMPSETKTTRSRKKTIETPVNEAELRSAEIVYEKRKDKYHKTTIEKIGDLGNYFVDNYIRPIKMLFVSQK
jgi:hypothetical protein